MTEIYSTKRDLRRLESRHRFCKEIIQGLWDLYDALWRHRCECLHDNTDINALSLAELNRRIEYYYGNKRKLVDSGDYDRFSSGVEHTLSLPAMQKRQWLFTISQRILATNRARNRLHNRMKPLTTYFPCSTETQSGI